jgi:hypothetical protein
MERATGVGRHSHGQNNSRQITNLGRECKNSHQFDTANASTMKDMVIINLKNQVVSLNTRVFRIKQEVNISKSGIEELEKRDVVCELIEICRQEFGN